MNLDLREIVAFPIDITRDFEADNVDLEAEGIALKEFLTVRVTVQKVKDEYFCQGYVVAPIEAECSRCLTLFDSEITGDLTFIARSESGKSVMSTDPGEDVVYMKEDERIIPLDNIVRQALLLSLPLKPLCSPECRGMCPNCGVNLNEENCDCKEHEIDERWEGLKDLLE
jgi:uncharacterized protein